MQGTERNVPVEWIYDGKTECLSGDELKDIRKQFAIVAVCAPNELFTIYCQSLGTSLKGADVGKIRIDKHVMAERPVLRQSEYR